MEMCVGLYVYLSQVSGSKDYVCLVLNKSWFCLMLVHTCVSECDRNAGYNLYPSWGQWGGGHPF